MKNLDSVRGVGWEESDTIVLQRFPFDLSLLSSLFFVRVLSIFFVPPLLARHDAVYVLSLE